MNNPTDQSFGLASAATTPNQAAPVNGGDDLQQLATKQSGYINQFMNSAAPASGQTVSQFPVDQQPAQSMATSPVNTNSVMSSDIQQTDSAALPPLKSNSSLPPLDGDVTTSLNAITEPGMATGLGNLSSGTDTNVANVDMNSSVNTATNPVTNVNTTPDASNSLPPLPNDTHYSQPTPIVEPTSEPVNTGASVYSQAPVNPIVADTSVVQVSPMQVSPSATMSTSVPAPMQAPISTPASYPTSEDASPVVDLMTEPTQPMQSINSQVSQGMSSPDLMQPVNLASTPSSGQPIYSAPTLTSAQPVYPAPIVDDAPEVSVEVNQAMPAEQVEQTEENPLIGTHQVAINEDYAESFNPNFRLGQNQQTQAAKPVEPRGIDFSRPATVTTVDHDFADAPQMSDDNFTSTGLLSAFDDSDNTMLPALSDDDDDLFADDDSTPYGFSDFDPNEQITVQSDLGGFESKSLEEVAENIDVDFSEKVPGQVSQSHSSQGVSVGVLTQEPQSDQSHVALSSQPHQIIQQVAPIEPATQTYVQTQNQPQYVQTTYTQIQPQIEPVSVQESAPSHTTAELSPAARLNQLLEAEEAAEKVIIQKQDQVLNQPTQPQALQANKESIFKQLDPDVSLQGDIRNGMAVRKPTSRYFLIISLVIIISVIGFLLVLLGLTLL